MHTHKEIVKEHEVHKKLEDVIFLLQKEAENKKYSQAIVDEFNREIMILNIVKGVFSNVDDRLLSFNNLEAVNSSINQFNVNFQQYRRSSNESHLNNMMKIADQIFFNISNYTLSDQLQYQIISEYTKTISDELKIFTDNIRISELNITDMNDKINKLKNIVENIKNNIENNEQIAKKENESRLIQLDRNINDFKNRMETEADRLKRRNEEMVQNSIKSVEDKMTIKDNKLQEVLDKARNSSDELQNDTKKKLNEYLETVKTIVGQVNTAMFSYKYKQVADDAKERAYLWNISFFASLSVSIMIAYSTIEYITKYSAENNFIYSALSRSIIIMISLTAAGYCGKQASNQGKVERYARKIEMELVAFDTFVESLPDDIKQKLKSDVVKRIFINRENIIEDTVRDSGGIISVLKDVMDKLSRITEHKN